MARFRTPLAPMESLKSELQRGLRIREQGRLEEALAVFESLVIAFPRAIEPIAYRGMTLCNLGEFERGIVDLEWAVNAAPRNAVFRANLGTVLFVRERFEEAEDQLRSVLPGEPNFPEAVTNLGLVLKAKGDFKGAEKAFRRALQTRPGLAAAEINLALALLSQGRFEDVWRHFSFRPHPSVNLRDPSANVGPAHVDRLPTRPTALILHGEQGLGDALFFLRFAPELRRRGHRLAFWGDTRLHALLARANLFEHFLRPESVPGEGLPLVWVGDLPMMLGATDPSEFPPPLPLALGSSERDAARGMFAKAGPPPYIGVSWRAGHPRRDRVVLAKEVPLEGFAHALAGSNGTLVSMQRQPHPGETEQLSRMSGLAVLDQSAVNDDLEAAFVCAGALDEYVTVSNTNLYLRESGGGSARVLIPWPNEWRWPGADRSAWFPAIPQYRQASDGNWAHALVRLGADLRG